MPPPPNLFLKPNLSLCPEYHIFYIDRERIKKRQMSGQMLAGRSGGGRSTLSYDAFNNQL